LAERQKKQLERARLVMRKRLNQLHAQFYTSINCTAQVRCNECLSLANSCTARAALLLGGQVKAKAQAGKAKATQKDSPLISSTSRRHATWPSWQIPAQ
jgi:hypothetical protein